MQQKRAFYLKFSILLLVVILFFIPVSLVISEAKSQNIVFAPRIINCSVDPTKVQPGDLMTVSVSVLDPFGVKEVQANFSHEIGFDIVGLSLVSGTIYRGVWQGQWTVHDTKVKEYSTVVTVLSRSSFSKSVIIYWFDPVPWWDLDWSYRKLITLNRSQVPSTQTNFPVLISITDTDLRDRAQADGDDIVFIDSNGNKLNHEIEQYTAGTGGLIAWVNVTSLSSVSDTEIFMYYGNAGCSNQENIGGTWDTNYVAVYHSNQATNENLRDSTSNNNHATPACTSGSNPISTSSGKVGKAFTYLISDQRRYVTPITSGKTFTWEVWVKPSAFSNYHSMIAISNQYMLFDLYNSGVLSMWSQDGMGGGSYGITGLSADIYYNLVFIREGDSTTAGYKFYKDGNPTGSTANTGTWSASTAIWLGSREGTTTQSLSGDLDEVRISKIARSASWIKTVYNTINNAVDGGFFSLESEERSLPTKPTLTYPENNDYTNNIAPEFRWTNGENQENNTLYVSNVSDFSEEHINVSLSSVTTSYITPGGKALGEGRWYWKVVANNSQGTNSSSVYSFIVDTTPPLPVTLDSPANDSSTDSNSVTFSWLSTNDNTTNTTDVSGIKWYQLQVDTTNDFPSPLVDAYTPNSATFSLTRTVSGRVVWRVRAWDQAGNHGEWSEIRNLTVFSYSLEADSSTIQIKRGTSGSTTLNIDLIFGDVENVSLSSQWIGDIQPSSITVSFSTQEAPVSFDSTVTFTAEESASTGTFTCRINATSNSSINRSVDIDVTVYNMLFSLDLFPRSISLIRSDQDTATASVNFDQGALSAVDLEGTWVGTAPSGVSTAFSPSSGTPNFDSTITFATSSSATAGSFVYRVTGTSSGLSKTANIYVDISKELTLTVTTNKQTYEKGQNIQISGTAKDPDGNSVDSGTVTVNLSAGNWSHTFTTSISNGIYSTSYYITFEKPDGDWDISVTATDSKGHETSSPQTTSVSVESPEIYEQYTISVVTPPAGQVFKRGETVTFTISLVNKNNERVQGADVKACLASGEVISFSEGSPGIYSISYDLGYDFPLGGLNIYVEGKRYDDEKLKVGFNFIDFKVSAVVLTMKLVELKPGDLVEVGEQISIKLEALYPNGNPVENSMITAIGPNGTELVFSKSKSERGMYIASYVPTEIDIGNWEIRVIGEDAYGNSYAGNIVNVEIAQTKILSYLSRYWWATMLGILITASCAGYVTKRKVGKAKLRKLKDEILELNKLKEKNAIFYYSDYTISRETYERLSQDYESRIAHLSKKQRMLEKKYTTKNKKKEKKK